MRCVVNEMNLYIYEGHRTGWPPRMRIQRTVKTPYYRTSWTPEKHSIVMTNPSVAANVPQTCGSFWCRALVVLIRYGIVRSHRTVTTSFMAPSRLFRWRPVSSPASALNCQFCPFLIWAEVVVCDATMLMIVKSLVPEISLATLSALRRSV